MVKRGKKAAKPLAEFEIGDLVAAKVKGHPTWPGFIEEVFPSTNNRKGYVVRFFYTQDKCSKFVELKPIEEMTASERKCSRKGFSEAMELCREQERSPPNKSRLKVARNNKQHREQVVSRQEIAQEQLQEKEGAIEEEEASPLTTVQDEQIDTSSPPTSETNSSTGERGADEQIESEKDDRKKRGIRSKLKQDRDTKKKKFEHARIERSNEKEDNNNTENKKHDEVPDKSMDCLRDSSSPDDNGELRQAKNDQKGEDAFKNCSLNDLTSEQANADRGNEPPTNKGGSMQVTKREITLAKLKKKIDTKLREKEEKKAAFKQQKSFEKASRGLPTLIRKFQPLSKSTASLIGDLENEKVADQVRSSMKECEKYLNSLAKCLKLMTSEYGQQQRECYELHCSLRKIVETLKDIKTNKSLPIARDCSRFLEELRATDGIKRFMNGMKFPLYNDSVTERKENSRVKRKNEIR